MGCYMGWDMRGHRSCFRAQVNTGLGFSCGRIGVEALDANPQRALKLE
jgi:hypothetical protein